MPNYSVSVLRNNEMLDQRGARTLDTLNINSDEELGRNNVIPSSGNKNSNN